MNFKLIIPLAGLAMSTAVFAEDAAKNPQEIQALLKQARPDLEFTEPTSSTVVDGYYEVKTGSQFLYVSESGEHLIAGDIFLLRENELVKLKDLEQRAELKQRLAALDPVETIAFSPAGPVKGYIHVFTDVDCGFCQKLHQDVPALNERGIEVRYLAFPRSGLESESYRKIASAWCADDQHTAITKLKNREEIPIEVCENNPVAAHYKMGNEINLSGTPTLIFPDGRMVGGYINVDRIAEILEIN